MRTAVVFVLTKLFAMGEHFEKTVIHATIGDTITLECPIISQNLSVQWVFLDTQLVLFDGFQINHKRNNETSSPKFEITGNPDLGEYDLKINAVDIQDKGDYKCETEIHGKIFNLVIRGFSIYKWIMIFMFAIVCIFILPLVVAGVTKVIRSNHGLNGTDTDIERAPEFLYETINDTGVIRAPSSGSPRSNITILRPNEHTLGSERAVTLCRGSNNVQSRSYATQLSVHIPDIFFDNKADSET